jgi:hypothetical protein
VSEMNTADKEMELLYSQRRYVQAAWGEKYIMLPSVLLSVGLHICPPCGAADIQAASYLFPGVS